MSEKTMAIMLCAGKGTRMKSPLAKVLHPIMGKPIMSYPVAALKEAGINDIVAVIGHQAEAVREYFGESLAWALQEEQKGTGHAVMCAEAASPRSNGTALILCGDVPLITSETIALLLGSHRETGNLVTVLSMIPEDPNGYGRLVRDERGGLKAIVEHKDASEAERGIREVNTGTFAVSMPWLWAALKTLTTDNSQGEYYLTDIVKAAAAEGRAGSFVLADPVEALGINDRVQLAEAAGHLRARINKKLMEGGVTIEDSASTWIFPGAKIAPDVTVAPFCRIEGESEIGSGSLIGQGCVIKSSHIQEGVVIKPYSVIESAFVGKGASVGPFAHLRPKARIMEGAKVGNFVEIKNTTLGEGSKASHLTYLGDAVVGKDANIGAGTITCNYDGKNKFRTVIGDGAFIGSNSSLVAPVEIGKNAVTGAGSTITKDVAEEALGISRAPQKTIDGWKKRIEGK
ncbi:bifunctional UDP-N-acetylglucosamine diphosphorylase/glucosamine-1-phosphate N-acetyltransferase GlmU [bacterium]|nr:MAG: bifunctional UDP-N-acetylglucosamine diphosphorylase/glucosamine-1-phosphate N-acetyltransferase GlmU [bacterium]